MYTVETIRDATHAGVKGCHVVIWKDAAIVCFSVVQQHPAAGQSVAVDGTPGMNGCNLCAS